ncbi:MAG: type IV secretion system DNA-binding domain-containing protein [Deltaproteobacteria bacterium]|nr:type IV secretion system DNA-binding domain-containing protein [Deltaproteobacteria bacterium]
MTEQILTIAKTNFRKSQNIFGIKPDDRLFHIYLIGKTGVGKTTLLENFIAQDIQNQRGLVFLDPHGDCAERIYDKFRNLPESDFIYFNVPDNQKKIGYNPIRRIPSEKRSMAALGILEVFKKQWDDSWGVRMEHIFRNALITLFDQPKANLADILKLLNDDSYRRKALQHVESPRIKDFWQKEFAKYSYRYRADSIAPIQNKVGAFVSNPIIYEILTEAKTNLSFRKAMDSGQAILVNLSKGKLGEDASSLLGSLLMTSVSLAALSRADTPEANRRDFALYADEFQNFTTLSLANMASELRKYHVGLVLANQYLHQLEEEIRHAILGNIGTLIAFRLGSDDAVYLEKEFHSVFDRYDLLNLPNHHILLKLMIDGKPSRPFSAITLPKSGIAV